MTKVESHGRRYQVLPSKLVQRSKKEVLDKALEYGHLSKKIDPSPEEEGRLIKILEEAQGNALLLFWIEEVDHILGHTEGDLEFEQRQDYRNQSAWLYERLEIDGCQENLHGVSSEQEEEEDKFIEQSNVPELC